MPDTSIQTTPSSPLTLHPAVAASLPSANSAMALVNGEAGALPLVVVHTVVRASIISVGLLLAGQRTKVVRTALAGSLAIEAFVLGWAAYQKGKAAQAPPATPSTSPPLQTAGYYR